MSAIGNPRINSLLLKIKGLSPVHKRELVILFVLAPAMVVSGAGVFQMLAEAWEPPSGQHGITFYTFVAISSSLGLEPNNVLIFGSFVFIGLFTLISFDEYKQTNGFLLLGVTAIGAAILIRMGVFIDELNWFQSPLLILGGFATGIVLGGLKRDSSGIYHDLIRNRSTSSSREFDRAMPRVFLSVSAIVILGLIERIFRYQSPLIYAGDQIVFREFQLMAVQFGESVPYILASAVFLGSIFRFRSNIHDKEIILLGGTGSGKSTTMAGIDYSIDQYMGGGRRAAKPNGPLEILSSRLSDGGLAAFPSTPTNQLLPLEFSYKHGVLFPRKVTIRTLDYAGDHMQGLVPHESNEDVITEDIDEVFEIAEYMLDTATPDGEDVEDNEWFGVNWFGDKEDVGKNPTDLDGFSSRGSKRDIVSTLIKDLIWHADSIGMLYPLEDYAYMTFERGTNPPYIEPDHKNKEVKTFTRSRDIEAYKMSYNKIEKSANTSDIFYVATFSDLAIRDFEYLSDWAEMDVNHLDRWDLFGRHIKTEFLNAGDSRAKSHLPDNDHDLVPIYYPIENNEPLETGEEHDFEIDLNAPDSRLPLHGSQELLDRMGE